MPGDWSKFKPLPAKKCHFHTQVHHYTFWKIMSMSVKRWRRQALSEGTRWEEHSNWMIEITAFTNKETSWTPKLIFSTRCNLTNYLTILLCLRVHVPYEMKSNASFVGSLNISGMPWITVFNHKRKAQSQICNVDFSIYLYSGKFRYA